MMNLVEFIIFFVTMFLLFLLFLKRAAEEKYRVEHPEEFEEERLEEEAALREFLQALDVEIEEPKPPRPPKSPTEKLKPKASPKPKPQLIPNKDVVQGGVLADAHYQEPYKTDKMQFGKMHVLHNRAYNIKGKGTSNIRDLIFGLKSKKDLILLNEIIGPSKGVTPSDDQ